MVCCTSYTRGTNVQNASDQRCEHPGFPKARGLEQAPESTAKKAFDFNSTVDSRRLSTLVYHSAHGISNIPPNIRRIFPADRLPLAGRQSTPGLGAKHEQNMFCRRGMLAGPKGRAVGESGELDKVRKGGGKLWVLSASLPLLAQEDP